MKGMLLGIAMLLALPVAAMAGQCPALQKQIDAAVGSRFDAGAASARQMAAEAHALHSSGKHAESVKKYEDAAKAGNVKLEMKK
jgi:hypothetical protein